MSDYMFMLDSHLTAEQARAMALVRSVAEQAQTSLFLTGGAMRDMMGGFPIRELDFTVEGPALKLAKSLADSRRATITHIDDLRKTAQLSFPGGVSAQLSMARQEKYPKPAAKPQVQPASIHEDLRCRDFTVNAIALSLGGASRGLLLDPTNGLGDLQRKELRTVSNYTLYDDPSRILRLIRLRVRLGYSVDPRSWSQYQNVREAGLQAKIPSAALSRELRAIAGETMAGEILQALETEGLLSLFSPALTGPKLNLPGFAKLQKAQTAAPSHVRNASDPLPLFLATLLQKLAPRERSKLAELSGLDKTALDTSSKLVTRASRFEKDLAAARFTKPSTAYFFMAKADNDVLLYLLAFSTQRIVLDRLRNYYGKYLPVALEVTDAEVRESGAAPATPAYAKAESKLIAAKLDARPKKPVPEEAPAAPAPPPAQPAPARRSATNSGFGR